MKRLILVAVCAALIILPFCFCISASTSISKIYIDSITGVLGDTVLVPVKISKNPGISEMAFSINFDKTALTYKGFHRGILHDYTVYDHSSNGKISFASIEGKDNAENGILICFEFQINNYAKEKTNEITFSKTYFANEKGEKVKLGLKNGSLKISHTCGGEHAFAEWSTVVRATCKRDGVKIRSCNICGHTENKTIPATNHNFEKTFTIDIIAKDNTPGMLSRHCTSCDTKTDIIIYTENNTSPLGINSIAENASDDMISNLVYFFNGEVNYPDIEDNNFDIEQLTASDKPVRNNDGSINVDIATDRLLRRIFGDDKKSGLVGTVKRAVMADEIPLKLIAKLISLIFM